MDRTALSSVLVVVLLPLAVLLMIAPGSARAGDQVLLVASVGDGVPTTRSTPILVTQATPVTLHAVIVRKEGKKKRYLSGFTGKVKVGKATVSVEEWPDDEAVDLTWYKVEPVMHHLDEGPDPYHPDYLPYTNAYWTGSPQGKSWLGYDTITYTETVVAQGATSWSLVADAHPTDPEYDTSGGLGVMRFAVQVTTSKGTARTPGASATGKLGIANGKVTTMVVRKDDTFVGWVTSYFNVPGVYGSVPKQVDGYLGVDCADLVVGAYRKWKKTKSKTYTSANGLPSRFDAVTGDLWLGSDGVVYADEELTTPKEIPYFDGAVVLIDYPDGSKGWFHDGVLAADDGDGFIDGGDTMLHAGPWELAATTLGTQSWSMAFPTRIKILSVD